MICDKFKRKVKLLINFLFLLKFFDDYNCILKFTSDIPNALYKQHQHSIPDDDVEIVLLQFSHHRDFEFSIKDMYYLNRQTLFNVNEMNLFKKASKVMKQNLFQFITTCVSYFIVLLQVDFGLL